MKALLLAGIAALGFALTGCDTYTTVDRGHRGYGTYGRTNVHHNGRYDNRYARRDVRRVNVYDRDYDRRSSVNRVVVRDNDIDRRQVNRVVVRGDDRYRRADVRRTNGSYRSRTVVRSDRDDDYGRNRSGRRTVRTID